MRPDSTSDNTSDSTSDYETTLGHMMKGKTKIKDLTANGVETVEESMEQHKYSRLANSSYDYFNSKGKLDEVHRGLMDSKYDYITDLKGFKTDTELSTIDNLVLHNPETGETHISYRGTTDRPLSKTRSFFNDWKINGEIAGGSTHSKRIQQAEKQIDQVIAKYGKNNLTTSGHSQGGHVSYEMAVRHDVEGHHYNPAINRKQVKMSAKYASNASKQTVYKTHLDFASPLSNKLKNSKVVHVSNLVDKDSVLATHSIDQFAPTPKQVSGSIVKAERRTVAGSILKGAGHIMGIGMLGYSVGEDIKHDTQNDHSNLHKAVASSIDIAKNGEQFIVDGEIMTASLALAPETMGASVVVGLGAVIVNDLVSSHIASEAKGSLHSVGKGLKKAGRSVKHFFGF